MRRAVTTAFCAAGLAAAGCGGGGGGNEAAGGLAREASAVIADLESSIAGGRFEHVCSELLSAEVRRQAGGGDCPAMLRRTSANLRRPRIEVKQIRIQGSTAAVEVQTTAEGQARVADTIRLVREAGRYRISSLSG